MRETLPTATAVLTLNNQLHECMMPSYIISLCFNKLYSCTIIILLLLLLLYDLILTIARITRSLLSLIKFYSHIFSISMKDS